MKKSPFDFIYTHAGIEFSVKDIKKENVCIEDIAHALSNHPRFSGHTDKFLSVAEHSYWVSLLVPPEQALAGLLHDASEAYICDIPSPFKAMLPDYQKLENKVVDAINAHFNIDTRTKEIKEHDWNQLITEAHWGFTPKPPWIQDYDPTKGRRPLFMPPDSAKLIFLQRYEQLTKCNKNNKWRFNNASED